MTKKYLFLLITGFILVVSSSSLFSAETIILQPKTPLFDKPLGRVIAVLDKEKEFIVLSKTLIKKEKFPLMKCNYYYHINLNNKFRKTAYVAPNIRVKLSNRIVNGRRQGMIYKQHAINWTLLTASFICAAALLYFIYFHCVRKKYKPVLSVSILVIFIFFFRWIILASLQSYPIDIFCIASDEHIYFKIAKDIISLNFSEQWKSCIGLPLYYIPFCLLFGQEDIYSVLMQVSKFNGFIIMPFITIMLFFIAKKITGSYKKSITFVFIFSLLPLFYQRHEVWDLFLFKSRFAFPALDGYRLYKQYLALGFNNLPDTPSAFIIILTILYALFGRKNNFYIFILSFLFAFSCLIRLNNIMLAPLIAMLFWFKFKDEYWKAKKILAHLILALFAFLLLFGLQLAINYHHFGSILSNAYSIGSADGSSGGISNTSYMSVSIKSMIGNNYLFMVIGLAGLIFQKNRKWQIILSLWTVPMILFFSTTNCISVAPYRYLIAVFPGLLLSFFALQVWNNLSKIKLTAVIIALTLTFVLTAPSGMSPFFGGLPFDLHLNPSGKDIVIFLYCLVMLINLITLFSIRKNKELCLFLIFLLSVFFIGNSFLIMALFLFVMGQTIVNIFREISPYVKHFYNTGIRDKNAVN